MFPDCAIVSAFPLGTSGVPTRLPAHGMAEGHPEQASCTDRSLGFTHLPAHVPDSLEPCWIWAPDTGPGRTRGSLYRAVGLPHWEKGFVSEQNTAWNGFLPRG